MSLFSSNIISTCTKLLSIGERSTAVLNDAVWKRLASKKTSGSSRNSAGVPNAKHRGIKVRVGSFVPAGTILVLQRKLRFCPGLNVGIGKNGTLFALLPGKISVTTEKIDPDMNNHWNQRTFGGKSIDRIYKKYFHIFPEPQHFRFKRIE